jgi:hypothetical protein
LRHSPLSSKDSLGVCLSISPEYTRSGESSTSR